MEVQKTALYNYHKNLGAKFVSFAGYEMPIQYKGIKEEHNHVRSSAGLFDVSHMGEFIVKGKGAIDFLKNLMISFIYIASLGYLGVNL